MGVNIIKDASQIDAFKSVDKLAVCMKSAKVVRVPGVQGFHLEATEGGKTFLVRMKAVEGAIDKLSKTLSDKSEFKDLASFQESLRKMIDLETKALDGGAGVAKEGKTGVKAKIKEAVMSVGRGLGLSQTKAATRQASYAGMAKGTEGLIVKDHERQGATLNKALGDLERIMFKKEIHLTDVFNAQTKSLSPEQKNQVATQIRKNLIAVQQEMAEKGIKKLTLSETAKPQQLYETLKSPHYLPNRDILNFNKDTFGGDATVAIGKTQVNLPSLAEMKKEVLARFVEGTKLPESANITGLYQNRHLINEEIGDRKLSLASMKAENIGDALKLLASPSYRLGDLKFNKDLIIGNEARITDIKETTPEAARIVVQSFVESHMPGLSLKDVKPEEFVELKAGIDKYNELSTFFNSTIDCKGLHPDSNRAFLKVLMSGKDLDKIKYAERSEWTLDTYRLKELPDGHKVVYSNVKEE